MNANFINILNIAADAIFLILISELIRYMFNRMKFVEDKLDQFTQRLYHFETELEIIINHFRKEDYKQGKTDNK